MSQSELVVAGHVCVDLTPEFNETQTFDQVFCPGRLSTVGKATISAGGAVHNTGLAAKKFGIDTVLMGKIGTDLFGGMIKERLSALGDTKLAMSISPDVSSSYSFVLNLVGKDRLFLHHPGANDDFYESDIDAAAVVGSKIFHFGYPPLMRSIYQNHGAELVKIFTKVKGFGVTTSLDMAMPDPDAASGRVDWERVLKTVAPLVDIFVPSYEELFLMLAREEYLEWRNSGRQQELSERVDVQKIREFARRLQEMGMGLVMIKAGKSGIYLRTPAPDRLRQFGSLALGAEWAGRELWAEARRPERFLSSTGAGDCAIAGFLAALIRGRQPQDALRMAAVAGWENLRAVDAISGLGDWDELSRELENHAVQYQEMDLREFGMKRLQDGLWGTEGYC